jgi:hypothetical protein
VPRDHRRGLRGRQAVHVLQQRVPEGLQGGYVAGSASYGVDQVDAVCLHRTEEEVLLRREVVEDGSLGHVRISSDFGDTDLVEAALFEQPTCGFGDHRSRLLLLAFAKAGPVSHQPTVGEGLDGIIL